MLFGINIGQILTAIPLIFRVFFVY